MRETDTQYSFDNVVAGIVAGPKKHLIALLYCIFNQTLDTTEVTGYDINRECGMNEIIERAS